jgi:surface carbohydrate biosynthesis protein
MFRILQRLGHEIGTWDEEALVYPSVEYYFQSRMSQQSMEALSLLLAWGNDNAEVFRKYPGYPGTPIHVVGNPRVDLLRRELRGFFDEDVRPIRERFGKFLLINTNFSKVNGERIRARAKRPAVDFDDPDLKKEMNNIYFAHKQALFDGFCAMTPALAAAFPEHKVIIRPHPSETHAAYDAIARECENVLVVDGGNVIPWLLASDAMIHNGCTTAIEAFALEQPTIAYRPATCEAWDHEVPNALSHECETERDLIARVGDAVRGELDLTPAPEQQRLFDEYVVGLDGALASDRIVDALDAHRAERGKLPRPAPRDWLRGRRAAHKRRQKREQARQSNDKFEARHQHRFPTVSLDDLQQRKERMDRSLGRFADVRIEPVAEKIFRITT